MKESCQTRRMFGHNYAVPGTYEITMVVAGRRPVFNSDYDRFHYLNRLAETVCSISHTTNVAVQGLGHAHGG